MTHDDRKICGGLRVDPVFHAFVESELLPAIGVDSTSFWSGVEAIVGDLTPVNRELLKVRDDFQAKIDEWHRSHQGVPLEHAPYVDFLRSIGYLGSGEEISVIDVENVDPEIAEIAGPQLVVPVSNARFAINAANARWGSLYDALYGTDVISDENGQDRGSEYNATRGAAVIRAATEFLDLALPLDGVSHGDVNTYGLDRSTGALRFVASLANGETRELQDPKKFVGFREQDSRHSYLFRNHGLHVEIQIDPDHLIGREATANVADVVLESAITTIQDCEDSVAAVDAADKVDVYRNWLGLMRVDLQAAISKNGKESIRTIAKDRVYMAADGGEMTLSGRSLLLVRNVGHLMTTDAILDGAGQEIFEGILDAIITTACAITDRRREGYCPNSRTGSIYIVKPKMHGPVEVAFTDELFGRVEQLFELEANTIKVGIMDEERRTTVNLPSCIAAAKKRVVFINTGFLDRTGDEIHTSMQAGAVLPKEAIKQQPWIMAYEDWNVDVGIRCGLPGRAQIGKGMWPKPDEMRQMMDTKQAHPEAGANCAWVPSPTAATLHAMHYHAVDVRKIQKKLCLRLTHLL
jgi:malate synthase